MRVTLVGGGKVGTFLAKELHKTGHVVTVIEESHAHAEALSDDSKVLVLEGDGTDIGLLEAADVDRSDRVMAVTGLDEVNLVACQGAMTLGVRNVQARLNNPLSRPTFEALDVPVVVMTDIMATLISLELEVGRGEISIYEIDVPSDFKETSVAALSIPDESLFVAMVSDGNVEVPTATTRARPGDQVTVASRVGSRDETRAALGRPNGSRR